MTLTFLKHALRPTLGAAVLISGMTGAGYAQDAVSTRDAVAAAHWSENATVTIGETTFRFVSDGIPNHDVAESYVVPAAGNMPPFGSDPTSSFEIIASADLFQESPVDVEIPLVPVAADTPSDTNMGMIGVMISGARLFNDYEDMARQVVALNDNLTIGTASFVDSCNAHTLQDGHQYHYHGVPPCISETVDQAGTHSAMIGVLLDGYPVYGPLGANGVEMTNADLDACSGHFEATPEFPDGIYHYHLTLDAAPYSIDCYHGVVSAQVAMDGGAPNMPTGGPEGGRPDFAAVASKLGIDEAALMDALGAPPPDFDAAAQKLGITANALRDAMGPPPKQ